MVLLLYPYQYSHIILIFLCFLSNIGYFQTSTIIFPSMQHNTYYEFITSTMDLIIHEIQELYYCYLCHLYLVVMAILMINLTHLFIFIILFLLILAIFHLLPYFCHEFLEFVSNYLCIMIIIIILHFLLLYPNLNYPHVYFSSSPIFVYSAHIHIIS
jgi:hypothetical protein